MEPKLFDECFYSLRALRELRDAGTLSLPLYYKGVVAIAYEFALAGENSWVVKLLLEIPVFYFQTEQLDQMLEDEVYCQLCVDFAKLLIMSGLAESGTFVINQPPGIA